MKMTEIAVDRPITASMLVGIVIVVSAVAFTRIPIDLMPDVQFPSLSLSVTYRGATPEEIETIITRPIEEAMGSVDNIDTMETTSAEEQANIRLMFNWGTDIDEAANDVRERLDRIRGFFPDEVDPPVMYKFDVNQSPVFRLGLFSDTVPVSDLRYLAEHTLQPRLERIAGVASVDLGGGRLREIQVNLTQEKLDALQLSPQTIVQAIRAENINLPAGEVYSGDSHLVMRTKGQFVKPEELKDIVVATRGGVPIYLRDVAEIEDGLQELRRVERVDGEPAISMYLFKQSGSNTVSVAGQVKDEIEKIRRDYPHLNLLVLFDNSKFIKDAISDVQHAAMYGTLIAIGVLLIFLRDIRATIVVASTIPVSIMATFSLMYFAGFTLNIVSFGGLALGIGLLVDNSIVVLENIYRHREAGDDGRTAAIKGTVEVTAPIIASTMTNLVVFLPLLFLSGAASIMFTQLAYVVAFSSMFSLFFSLTLVPTLARILLVNEAREKSSHDTVGWKVFLWGERILKMMEDRYRGVLHFALAHRFIIVTVSATLFAISLPMFKLLGFEYMPTADEGEVRVFGRMAAGTRLEAMEEVFMKLEGIVREQFGDEIAHVSTRFGEGSSMRSSGANSGSMDIILKDRAERTESSEEIAERIRPAISGIPGVRAFARASGGLFIFRMITPEGDEIDVEVRGYDRDEGLRVAEEVRKKLETIEGITDAQISRSEGRPEIGLQIDRYKASEAGLTVSSIAENIRTNFGGIVATRYREGGEEYDVLVRLREADRQTIKNLQTHWITGPSGERVPASNFLTEGREIGPSEISRKDQERILQVSADLEPGYSLGNVMEDVKRELRTIQLPEDFTLMYGGEYEEQQKSYNELMLGIALAVLLVYMVMAAQFESIVQPLVVMFSIPFAAIGVLGIMWLTKTTVNVQSVLGMIVLVGIVVNNAIVLVDYINMLRREHGYSLYEAVEQGGRRRLRPIMMTTVTTMLALVPLALGIGAGGDLQAPMARVIFGGMLTSTLITLVFVPIVYTSVEEYFERRKQRVADLPALAAK